MKLKVCTALVFGFAAVIRGQSIPTCASDCLTTYLDNSSCKQNDFDCICGDVTLMGNVQTCTLGSCTIIEALAAKNVTATLCKEPVRDKSHVAPIATAVTGIMALALVALRASNCWALGEYQWADLCAVLAMVFSLPMDIFEFYMMAEGMGKDIWTLTPQQITDVVKYTWVTQVFYIPAIILPKMAIVLFYLRVFPGTGFRKLCLGTLVHCGLFMISTTIAEILACVPVPYAWSRWSGEGKGLSYDNTAFWWAHSAINIATDLWILGLPIPRLIKLQLGLRKKVFLVMMFSVGIIITVVSIVRFYGLITYSTSSNPTYNNVMVATYSVIECNVSIMCCCMPSVLSCLRRFFPGIFGSTNGSHNYNAASGYNKVAGPRASAFPSAGIQKTVQSTVSYMPRCGDSDVVELMEAEEQKRKTPWY